MVFPRPMLEEVRVRDVIYTGQGGGFVKSHENFEFVEFIVPQRSVVCTVKPVIMALILGSFPSPPYLWFWGPVYNS